MDTVVKVLLDEKEYERLREIERKFQAYEKSPRITEKHYTHGQRGDGEICVCSTADKEKNPDLSEVIARNEEAHALKTPLPGILPTITSQDGTGNLSDSPDVGTVHDTINPSHSGIVLSEQKYMRPWYYIGPPIKKH